MGELTKGYARYSKVECGEEKVEEGAGAHGRKECPPCQLLGPVGGRLRAHGMACGRLARRMDAQLQART